MYGQGNHAAQGTYPSRPTFPHRLPGPPPPPFQQGPPVYQHGPPPVPPHIGQPGNPVYQHHLPPGAPQQVPQLCTGISMGQSYLSPHLPPPPPHPLQAHGGSQVPHVHSTSHQQSQWAHQNVHQVPSPVPTSGPANVMPPRAHGLAPYRGQVPPGGIHVLQHAPSPPPHPLPSSSFAPSSFGSNAIPVPQHPHMPSTAPPPPPPPPLPSSPPRSPPHPPVSYPPTSSAPSSKSHFSANILGRSPHSHSTFDAVASDSVDSVIARNQSGDNLTALCNASEHDGATGSSVQPSRLIDAGISHSPSDSDMDMEDDITHPNGEEQTPSFKDPNHGSFPVYTEHDMKQMLQVSWNAAKCGLAENTVVGKLSCSASSGSGEQDQVSAGPRVCGDREVSSPGKLPSELDGCIPDSIGQTEQPFHGIPSDSSCPNRDLIRTSASAYVAGNVSEKLPNEKSKGTSPFRLLQDYASDDSSESDHLKHINSAAVSLVVKAGIASFDADVNHNSGGTFGPQSLLEPEKGFDHPVHESSAVCSLSMPSESPESSLKSHRVVSQADMTAIAAGKFEEFLDNMNENQECNVDSSHEVLQNTNAAVDVMDGHSRSANLQKEDRKSMAAVLKVDEFGRLVRDNQSDCDSGGSPRYTRRRGRRGRSRSPIRGRSRSRSRTPRRARSRSRSRSPIRARSRSRSRSPYDRRRRSPWRRKERHGRSRSQSPKRHSRRSISPSYRRGGEFDGDKIRRDKSLPECFDFTRGKCYRGASCRYLHHESDKTDRSRPSRSKHQHQDVPTSSKSSDIYGETETAPPERSVLEHNEHKSQVLKQDDLVMEERKYVKEDLGKPTTQLYLKESHQEPPDWQAIDSEAEKVPGDLAHPGPASVKSSETQQTQVHCSDQELQTADHQPQQMNDLSSSQISSVQISATMQSAHPANRPYLNQDSVSKSNAGVSSMGRSFSSKNISSQTLVAESSPSVGNVPSSFPSLSQDNSTTFSQQMPGDHNSILSASKLPHQLSQFPVPSTTFWNSLPPPPPPFSFVSHSFGNVTPGQYGFPSEQFQQSMPSRNDFPYETSARPYGTEFRSPSQVAQQDPYRSLYHSDEFGPRSLPVMSKPMGQFHAGPGPGGEDCLSGRAPQDVYPKSSFFQDNVHAQGLPFPRGSPSQRTHTFPGGNVSPGGHATPTSQTHSYLRQPSYGLLPAPDGVSAHFVEPGKVVATMSRYTSDNLERNQLSRLSTLGGSRISNHFNPYASTFDQPLSSKFSSNILTQVKETPCSINYGSTYNMSHVPADALADKGILPKPVGDQYDPLHDSIEPSSNSVKKPDSIRQHEQTDDSDVMLRMKGSIKPLGLEENVKQKGNEDVGGTTSLENDECGETADAEVGAVEDGSASSPENAADVAVGEVEIDQVKAAGKSKTGKDSKSTKHFKIAIADFVKEVLKPSWRQGNMSKEAFKTIVKKTVNKVSGAMKSHQIPKSRAKIEHYIDSSQRKLTKLVMGYVDKYVKV